MPKYSTICNPVDLALNDAAFKLHSDLPGMCTCAYVQRLARWSSRIPPALVLFPEGLLDMTDKL